MSTNHLGGPYSGAAHAEVAPPTVGALTRLVWLAFRERIYAAAQAAGYTDVTRAHMLAFRYPTIEGVRPGELAEQMGMSKQATNDLLRHMERRGYLELHPDPSDGRARLIRLTERGSALMELARTASAEIAEEWANAVGPDRLDAMRTTLLDLLEYATAHPPQPPDPAEAGPGA